MMKSLLAGLLFSSCGAYAADNYIDILPLQSQFRYEETVNQSKDYVTYQSFGAAIQVSKFRLGLDYSYHRDQTGNASYNVEARTKDFILSGGYQVFMIESQSLLRLDIFANALMGVSEAEVNTTLLGATTKAVGDQNPIFGLGAAAVGRYKIMILEIDVSALNSKGFSPTTVFTTQAKVGLSFSI